MTARLPSFPRLQIEPLEDRMLLATYYVAPTGSNGNSGLSDSAAWATLQHAADRVVAGDTVIVRAGTYVGFDLRGKDGTLNQRIQFRADDGVVINQRNNRTNDGINIEGVDYVTIRGFTVLGIGRAGIRSVDNTGVWIIGNRCDQNGTWGILTGHSNYLRIENNETSRSAVEHGIYVSNSCVNPVVRNNHSWGNHANGLHFNGDISLGGNGLILNATIEGNVIHGNGAGGGSEINCDGVQNSVIRNNLLYNNHASGISLYRIDAGGGASNNVVVNNTVLVSASGRWALNIQNGSTGNKVFNNIFWNQHSWRGAISISTDSLTGFQSNFNAVIGRFTLNGGGTVLDLAAWRQQTNQDSNSFIATPAQLFVNASTNDYHLKVGSPAIDAGTTNKAPTIDFEGQKRDRRPDIGADEYFSSTKSAGGLGGGAAVKSLADGWFAEPRRGGRRFGPAWL